MKYGSFYIKTGIRIQETTQSFSVKNLTTEITDEYQYDERVIGEEYETHVKYIVLKESDGNNGFTFRGYNDYTYDTTLVKATDTTLVQHKNETETESTLKYKIQYLDVPFLVGYEYQLKSKWLLEVNTGVHIGFLLRQSGSTFNYATNEAIDIAESSFSSKTTLAVSAGVGGWIRC